MGEKRKMEEITRNLPETKFYTVDFQIFIIMTEFFIRVFGIVRKLSQNPYSKNIFCFFLENFIESRDFVPGTTNVIFL